MKRRQQLIFGLLTILPIMVGLQLSARPPSPNPPSKSEHARVERLQGSDVKRVILSAKAAERLGIQTASVREESVVRKRRVGGEVVVLPTGSATATAALGKVWVRVPLIQSDLTKVDRSQPARILPLSSADGASGLIAQPDTAPANADSEAALYYAVNSADHSLKPGQRVLVEISLLGGGLRKIIPYAALIYDLHGETFVYTSPEPRVFIRRPITVDYIDGELAILSEGPPVGTEVATVGVIELWGAESGVGGGH